MIHKIAFILLIIGGLNWLLEAFGYGLGEIIKSGVMTVVYILIGLAALYEIFAHKSICKSCAPQSASM